MRDHCAGCARLVLCGAHVALVVASGSSQAQQAFTKEMYQDFRGKKLLGESWKMIDPDHERPTRPI